MGRLYSVFEAAVDWARRRFLKQPDFRRIPVAALTFRHDAGKTAQLNGVLQALTPPHLYGSARSKAPR
jgi:hypothetical protein